MDKRAQSQQIGIITLMVVITAIVAFYSLRPSQAHSLPPLALKPPMSTSSAPAENIVDRQTQSAPSPQTSQPGDTREIVVDVAGAVFRPDVYHLPPGSRVNDAMKAAGGATQNADTNSLNLASPVQDGSKVYVPQRGEASRPSVPNSVAPPQIAGTADSGAVTPGDDSGGAPDKNPQGPVNINTASLDELQQLPGIGPAIAQRIIDYRASNGDFKSPEDLKNVSGIGDKKFAKLAAYISVN